MSKSYRKELFTQMTPDEEQELARRGYDYLLSVAKRLGIKDLDAPVTSEERQQVRQSLSKGDPLSRIVVENRGGDD